MIDGIPNRPLYFYQKDIIGWFPATRAAKAGSHSKLWFNYSSYPQSRYAHTGQSPLMKLTYDL